MWQEIRPQNRKDIILLVAVVYYGEELFFNSIKEAIEHFHNIAKACEPNRPKQDRCYYIISNLLKGNTNVNDHFWE